MVKKHILFIFTQFIAFVINATVGKDTVHITLSIPDPTIQTAQVSIQCNTNGKDSMVFKIPQWTPGYYQIMDYYKNLNNFKAFGDSALLQFTQPTPYTWVINTKGKKNIDIQYDVLAKQAFVATSIIDSNHAYITPAATFLYPDKKINTSVSLTIVPYRNWNRVACGLDSIKGKKYTYTATNFDILFDCPILAGNLEELPQFTVNGITHRFIGYNVGNFDKKRFINDLKKIVESSVNIMHDIPYKHYTFLAIGPGNGGIEHLTSSANSFSGSSLNTEDGRKTMLNFLAHEYFHHYNVKRVRPIELGPFDYDNGSKTNQLWVSEGWTVYYEYLITTRAGIIDKADLLRNIRSNILAFEKHNGKNHQTLSQSSAHTWQDGPFGNDPEKTISYYTKGPVVAMMLDFAIRHYTQNKNSLDDVMRRLYTEIYKNKNRGFTEDELKKAIIKVGTKNSAQILDYVYSTKPLDYKKYFEYGGLSIDTFDNKFEIQPIDDPSPLQKSIFQSWINQK